MSPPDGGTTSRTLLGLLGRPVNEAAWAAFVGRYSPLILAAGRAAGLQPADAEEVRSRVLARLVSAMAGFAYDPRRTFRGYLRAVVRNEAARFWAERARPGATGVGGPGPDDPNVPGPLDRLAADLDDRILDRLRAAERAAERVRAQVKPETWRAYWETAVEGRRAGEVARELGKTVGAVHMARHRVAKLLAAEGRALAGGGGGDDAGRVPV